MEDSMKQFQSIHSKSKIATDQKVIYCCTGMLFCVT